MRSAKAPVPTNDAELAEYIKEKFGVTLPSVAVCPGHVAPFTAFADAYFARAPVTVWKAARGFGGKTFMLALLGLIEAITLGCDVNVLGGSGQQSASVVKYMDDWFKLASIGKLLTNDAQSIKRLSNGSEIVALLASTRSARSPHIPRLRCDEIDEMDLRVLDAALGQPMDMNGVRQQTVLSSTHQYADKTMTEVLSRAALRGWPVYQFCWRETLEPHGWLTQEQVDVKRATVTEAMWCIPFGGIVLDSESRPIEIGSRPQSILSGNGNEQKVARHWIRRTNEELVSIKVQGLPDPIVLTGNHIVVTRDGEKPASEIMAWDRTWSKSTHRFGSGDFVLSPKRKLRDGGDYELGWFIGLYLAEGSSQKDRGNRLFFSLAIEEGNFVLDRFRSLVAKYPYEHSGPGFKGGLPHTGINKSVCTVSLSHKLLKELLCDWVNVSNGALSKELRKLPTEKDLARGLLDGWIYGDGAITKQGWVGVTYSKILAWQMNQIATDLGFATGITHAQATGTGFSNNDFYHVRIGRMTGRTSQVVDLGNCVARRVRSVGRVLYRGDVCDMTVSKDHSYIAGGVIVHNSAEYDLQDPSPESRAINSEAVARMFKRELGVFEGGQHEYIEIETPQPRAVYVTGADWARKQDWTIIYTLRLDCNPARVVAFERMGREPWPVMIERFDKRVARFPGAAAHDATGIGDVVGGYMHSAATGIVMVGRTRSDMLSGYIAAIERGEIIAPFIRWMEKEHRLASVDDVYGSGHLPDTISAGALAWALASAPVERSQVVYAPTKIGPDW